MKVFVSHSSKDMDLVNALYDLIKNSLHLRAEEIVCTSRPGSKLAGGADPPESIRRYISDVPAFVGVVSPNSLRSTYVVCELGARWGQGKHMFALLSSPEIRKRLLGPLVSNNLVLSVRTDVQQLIRELAELLNCETERPDAYDADLQRVIDAAVKISASTDEESPQEGDARRPVASSDSGTTLRSPPAREVRSMRSVKPPDLPVLGDDRGTYSLPHGVSGFLKIKSSSRNLGEYQFSLDVVNNSAISIRIDKALFEHPRRDNTNGDQPSWSVVAETLGHGTRRGNFVVAPHGRLLLHAWWTPGDLEETLNYDEEMLSMALYLPEGRLVVQDGPQIKRELLIALHQE